MNNTRRKSLQELIEKTEGLKLEIEELRTEEEEYCKYPFYYIFFRGIRKYMG